MKPDSSRDAILRHLDEHGVVRKDACRSSARRPRGQARTRKSPHQSLDLHGMTQARAELAIREVFEQCRHTGQRSILLIHGCGLHSSPNEGPVLNGLVRQLLEGALRARVRDYRTAPPALGGGGATLVFLR